MKIIITTQYRENYGAHSWDGEGECPQYWKGKGGDILIVLTDEDFDLEVAHSIVDEIEPLVTYKNNYSENYIVIYRVLGDAEDTDIPDYEPEILIQKIDGKWHCTKKYFGKAWYGNQNYDGKTETFVMLPEGGRENYDGTYYKKVGIGETLIKM